MNCDIVATGHYARIKKDKTGLYRLLKGKDRTRDQSYFLWRLTQTQLSRVVFPLGNITKLEVRALAQNMGLPAAAAPASQEICFAPEGMDKFICAHLGVKKGNIVDVTGKVIGQHNGLWFYTIGQRKGIGLPDGPYYVQKKDFAHNRLVVTKHKADLRSGTAIVGNLNWIRGRAPICRRASA